MSEKLENSDNVLLSCISIQHLPHELIMIIFNFAETNTFRISKVCKLWKTLLDTQARESKLFEKDKNNNYKKEKKDIIEAIYNNPYLLSSYIKNHRVIDDIHINRIHSADCLDIIIWNMYKKKTNEVIKVCPNCKSQSCGSASINRNLYETIIKQCCKVNSSPKLCKLPVNTLLSSSRKYKKTIKQLAAECAENKFGEMEKMLLSYG